MEECHFCLILLIETDEQQAEDELGSLPDLCADDDPDLLGAEQKRVGVLAWGVYKTYWFAVGRILAASILMSLLLMQGLEEPWIVGHIVLVFKVYLLEHDQEKLLSLVYISAKSES